MNVAERGDPSAFLQRAFMLIGMGRVSSSGPEAVEMGLYPQGTAVSFAKDFMMGQAKGMVLEALNRGYAAPTPRTAIKVLGDPGIQTFKMMLYNMVQARQASAHDALIGEKIATILCGGAIDGGQTVSEQYLLDLEREAFVDLTKEPKTRERIEHMLKTGKPLRN
jgi:3-hydroxyacyl-CoA dehydrogenase